MKQFNLKTAASKRLIGKGMAQHPDIQRVLKKGTLLIIAGTRMDMSRRKSSPP